MTKLRQALSLLVGIALVACSCAVAADHSAAPEPGDDSVDVLQSQVQVGAMHIDLSAAEADWDITRRTLVATGPVTIVAFGGEMQGDRLTLDLARQSGQISPVTAQLRGLRVRAASLDLSQDRLVAVDARITTCDRADPHYQIRARRAVIHLPASSSSDASSQAERTIYRVEVDGAGLDHLGRRLATLPSFGFARAAADAPTGESLPLPYPGYSNLDGPFVRYRWAQELAPWRLTIQTEAYLSGRHGIRAVASSRAIVTGEGDSLLLAVSRKEDLGDQPFAPQRIDTGLSRVLVSRQPEISLATAPRHISSAIRWSAAFAAGQYRQESRGSSGDHHAVSDTRAAVTPALSLGPFEMGGRTRLEGVVAYRAASYGRGDHSAVFYRRISLDTDPAPGWKLSLDLVRRTPRGESPFRFDRVDMTNGLTTALQLPAWGPWRVRLLDLYDLRRGRSRDVGASVTYRAHCLDYSLDWRRSRTMLSVGVRLADWEVGEAR